MGKHRMANVFMMSISIGASLIAYILFAYVAWEDFRRWKVENRIVLLLLALFIIHTASAELAGGAISEIVNVTDSLLAALLLFTIGFVAWLIKIMGAGDAKLLFPVGLFVGWHQLFDFAIGLLFASIIVFLLIKLPLPLGLSMTRIGMRIDEIRSTRKVPYAVVIVLPLLIILTVRYINLLEKL